MKTGIHNLTSLDRRFLWRDDSEFRLLGAFLLESLAKKFKEEIADERGKRGD